MINTCSTEPSTYPRRVRSIPAATRQASASTAEIPSAAPRDSEERSFATSPAKITTSASQVSVVAAMIRVGERIPLSYHPDGPGRLSRFPESGRAEQQNAHAVTAGPVIPSYLSVDPIGGSG